MSGDRNNPKYNSSGCPDPTAYRATQNLIKEERIRNKAVFLIRVIRFIVSESGFELVNPLEVKDRKSGKVFR